MRRRLLTLLTALLLLPCVAAAGLWVRSFYAFDRLAYCPLTDSPGGFRTEEYTVSGWRGILSVSLSRHDFKRPLSPDPVNTAAYAEMYNRNLRKRASTGNDGWVWKVQPPTDCPFGDDFTGRTFRDVDAVYRGWVAEWTTPYWFVLLLSTLPLGLRVFWPLHGRRKGLCPACGYDLRATPERCPECGTVPKTSN